ncbi:helix-turn-helix transcriptional regulator [Marinobacter sp. TBZ242]|uniref:Helix-turn-helix transcriptional regulator n=1 Tax=Marinobacter azerbaijanicus TaxID=3050455 RepID=A0ABT7IIV2_9GAMM|nr:helix-turn-helix transcriptional regulator [Marinobacter sp. TBZ242]MDL0434109.1 helix-turn-helix transcriptional regulator [Marinobacter sp. TBZ242]
MSSPFLSTALASSLAGPRVIAVERKSGTVRTTCRHCHARGQLLGSLNGLVSVETEDSQWVVPATHAVWMPPGVVHGTRSHGAFAGWSAYVLPSACADLPDQPCILAVSGLLREVVARLAKADGGSTEAAQSRLADVLLDEIRALPREALGLPMPKDARLLKIARALSNHPADDRRLREWAEWVAMAPRTLSRRFVIETGFTLTEWRQRVRLLRALEMLAVGKAVTYVALELGYENVSAFIALFRRTYGVTPGQYASFGVLHSDEINR